MNDVIERLRYVMAVGDQIEPAPRSIDVGYDDARAILAHIDTLTAELAAAKAHIEALQAKDAGGCGCAHDSPGDVCQHHAQRELSAGEHTK